MARFISQFMNAAGAASQAALRNRRSAIELGLSPIAPAKRVAAIKQMLPNPKASGAMEAIIPKPIKLNRVGDSNAGRLLPRTLDIASAGGFSGVDEIPKTLPSDSLARASDGKIDFDKHVFDRHISTSQSGNDFIETTREQFLPIFQIKQKDGTSKRVAFGEMTLADQMNSVKLGSNSAPIQMPTDAELIPMNPYAITGLSRESAEGKQVASDFVAAMANVGEGARGRFTYDDGVDQSRIAALLYAGVRGDKTAMDEFNSLATSAKAKIADARAEAVARNLGYSSMTDAQIAEEGYDRIASGERGLQDLFAVHEVGTEFGGIQVDRNGDAIIYPKGHYRARPQGMPELYPGGPFAPATEENMIDHAGTRVTTHWGLNDLVAPVIQTDGGRPGLMNSDTVVVNLQDLLDANPGSLDNLQSYDTILTPQPGKPIVVPKGKYKIVKRRDGELEMPIMDAIGQLGGDTEYLSSHPLSRAQGDIQVAEAALNRVANRLQVPSVLHSQHPTEHRENLTRVKTFGLGGTGSLDRMGGHVRITPGISDLALSGENYGIQVYDLGLASGIVNTQTKKKVTPSAEMLKNKIID